MIVHVHVQYGAAPFTVRYCTCIIQAISLSLHLLLFLTHALNCFILVTKSTKTIFLVLSPLNVLTKLSEPGLSGYLSMTRNLMNEYMYAPQSTDFGCCCGTDTTIQLDMLLASFVSLSLLSSVHYLLSECSIERCSLE